MDHAETCKSGVNDAGTGGEIDTPLTQRRSLDVLARRLARLRLGHPAANHISNLIQQIKNYPLNPDALRSAMLRSIERIERHQ